MALLEVSGLRTTFHIGVGEVQAVRGISFHVDRGEFIGIVGESGSGKSVTMLSVTGLLPNYAEVQAEAIRFDGRELSYMTPGEMRSLHGKEIGMIFQDPMTSLNPLFTVENQMVEPLRIHLGMSRERARLRAVELLHMVEIPDPEHRLRQYPHEFSGGMRQRVMIAIAIACSPKMVVADEPTTALDVTIQAQILELLENLKREMNTAVVMITHDLGVIASMCSRILVMYGGIICEEGNVRDIFYHARHPYTWGLLNSIPKIHHDSHEKLVPIRGTPPDMLKPPTGCPFAPRCSYCMPVCRQYMAPATDLGDGHVVHCHLMHPNAPKVERGGPQHD